MCVGPFHLTETLRSDDDGGGDRIKSSRGLVCTDDDGNADSLHGLEDYRMAMSVPDNERRAAPA